MGFLKYLTIQDWIAIGALGLGIINLFLYIRSVIKSNPNAKLKLWIQKMDNKDEFELCISIVNLGERPIKINKIILLNVSLNFWSFSRLRKKLRMESMIKKIKLPVVLVDAEDHRVFAEYSTEELVNLFSEDWEVIFALDSRGQKYHASKMEIMKLRRWARYNKHRIVS